jgi:malate dehydrogenase (quinone)
MTAAPRYDTVIIGGGVTGTAVLHVLSRYTNVRRIALVEKYGQVATVNSNPRNNSQTLHFGDIETNYTLEHALPVQDAAQLMMNYVTSHPEPGLYRVTPKMVLAVGAAEVAAMTARFAEFAPHYPGLQLLGRDELAELEPVVVAGRDPRQPVAALLSRDGYAINYQLISESFLRTALDSDAGVTTYFDTDVQAITRQEDDGFVVQTGAGALYARTVVVAAGPYSLLFAQAMGYATQLAMMPVAGSFYFSNRPVLRGKVYTVQTPQLPFAAVHGDPDVVDADHTRFGPTAKVIPLLERHHYNSVWPFLRTPVMTVAGLLTMVGIMRNTVIARFILRNLFYDLPLVGKWLYLRQVRKIIPATRWGDIRLGKGLGGLRPQIIDTKARTMQMGESKIIEPGIIFNTTPSPGASVSLKNAETDVRALVGFLGEGYTFDQAAFDRELRAGATQPTAG